VAGRPDVAGLGPDTVIAAGTDSGPYGTDGYAVAFTHGGQLLIGTPQGTTIAYESAPARSGLLIRAEGFRKSRLAFVDIGTGQTDDSLVVTVELRPGAKPVVLDHVQIVLAGGGPWDDEPRPITDGYQVLWLRYERTPAPSYVLLRSLGGEPGTEIYRSPDPFLFTANDLGDVIIATRSLVPTGMARLQVLGNNGRLRTIAERPTARAGAPLAVADRFGWTDGLIERRTAIAAAAGAPTTAVDLWNVLSGEHQRLELPCAIAGATTRHLVAGCADRYVVRDILTGGSGELPREAPMYLVVAKDGLVRGTTARWTVAPVTSTIERFPDPPPTAAWSSNRAPGADAVSVYIYYGSRAPFLGAATRLVDRSGAVIANGPVLGSGIFGPESCAGRIDGSLYNVFRLPPAIVDDLSAHPDQYAFEVEFGGAWHRLKAIDSGCRTALPP
jgi:hypothetical protein